MLPALPIYNLERGRVQTPPRSHDWSHIFSNRMIVDVDGTTVDFWQEVATYRDYYNGDHPDKLTTKQRALIGSDVKTTYNVCTSVVQAVSNRLTLDDIQAMLPDTGADNTAQNEEITALLWSRLKQSRVREKSDVLNLSALRDGDSFVIVDFDYNSNMAVLHVNQAFDGQYGVDVVYEDYRIVRAIKTWNMYTDNKSKRKVDRMNIYLPDRILKLVTTTASGQTNSQNHEWLPYEPNGGEEIVGTTINGYEYVAAVEWWTDNGLESGQPLGIPVFHFPYMADGDDYGKSKLKDVLPLQDGVNRSYAAYIMAAELSGFAVDYVVGYTPPPGQDTSVFEATPGATIFIPLGDNNNMPSIAPRQVSNLQQLGEVIDRQLRYISTLTNVPMAQLNPTGQISAEGTLQQQEVPLLAEVENIQLTFGNRWEDVARMLLKLEAWQGNIALSMETINQMSFEVAWASAVTRNEVAEASRILSLYQANVITLQQARRELGYTPEEIAAMESEETEQAQAQQTRDTQMLVTAIDRINNGQTEQPNNTQASAVARQPANIAEG